MGKAEKGVTTILMVKGRQEKNFPITEVPFRVNGGWKFFYNVDKVAYNQGKLK